MKAEAVNFAAMAFAMPRGCPEQGIEGPAVKLCLYKDHDSVTLNVPEAGARQMHAQLGAALAAFDAARSFERPPAAEGGDRADVRPAASMPPVLAGSGEFIGDPAE